LPTPHQILKQYFGYDHFREGQLNIIQNIIDAKDTLAILPTGGGKSICYQIPALLLPGKCIVVTPLIALMKDQVIHLLKRNISAIALHSGLSNYEIDYQLQQFTHSDTKFIFISPERLLSEKLISYAQIWDVSLLVVDEAHCISQWGYDFRPSYLQISEFKQYINPLCTLALTASATNIVQQDIEQKLGFKQTNCIKQSIHRTNISTHVRIVENKVNETLKIVNHVKACCIVYCRNRGTTITIADTLNAHGIKSVAYHGGMDMQSRNTKQDEWINDKVRVVVCTNAFGMGIDKPNVRCVVHYDAPESVEAYYQEAGRAGRDGQQSFAVLLQRKNEWDTIDERITKAYPSIAYIKKVYQQLGEYLHIAYEDGEYEYYNFDFADFCKQQNLDVISTHNSLKLLEQQEFIKLTEGYYIPSRIMCVANREDMTAIENYHPQLDKVLKAILRLYGGIINNYVNVQEYKIAEMAEMDIQLIKPYIFQLQQLGILHYTPAKDKPQIQFLQERLRDYDVHIKTDLIQFLKIRFTEQLKSMQAFCDTNQCRMQTIAEYFNETQTKQCGICDNCINKKKKEIKQEQFEILTEQILELFNQNKSYTINELLHTFSTTDQSNVNTILHYLINENKIYLNQLGELECR
jgi:ATP-dependent DNA helicase RecQ